MVRHLLHFARDARGTSSERWAIIAAVAAVACVLGTHLLDAGLRNGAVPTIVVQRSLVPKIVQTAAAPPETSVRQVAPGIDYTATGSIPAIAAGTRLDPCTGQAKP